MIVGWVKGFKELFIVVKGIEDCLLIDVGHLFITGFISLYALVLRFTLRRFITVCLVGCRLVLA